MKNIKKAPIASTLFLLVSFFYSAAIAHAETGKCAQISNKLKASLSGVMTVHKGMNNALNSEIPIDKYNRHVNILVGNLDHQVSVMEKLLDSAEYGGCDKLVQGMRVGIKSAKNIYKEMMTSIQLPAPKEPLMRQNKKLKSELDNLMKVTQ